MAKSILISIKPRYVADILNHKKTIEVRKSIPKCDLPIDVYIYCTKSKSETKKDIPFSSYINAVISKSQAKWKGKVVAKFTLNMVEEITIVADDYYTESCIFQEDLEKRSCLTDIELNNYLKCKTGYAWHISNLVIFDKPKELSEFYKVGAWKIYQEQFDSSYMRRTEQEIMKSLNQTLTKAPQSYMFIEVE